MSIIFFYFETLIGSSKPSFNSKNYLDFIFIDNKFDIYRCFYCWKPFGPVPKEE